MTDFTALHSSAEQGDANAQFLLAAAYDLGESVPVNHDKAESLLLKAAKQGHLNARTALASIKAAGKGKVCRWYQLPATFGVPPGRRHVSISFEMTREQFAAALERVRNCMSSDELQNKLKTYR